MHLPQFLIATSLMACAGISYAQAQHKPPSPEEMQKMMDAAMGSMVPAVGKMTEVMLDVQRRMAPPAAAPTK